MSQQEVLCPNCKGGNSPQAIMCQWCGRPLTGQPPAQPTASSVEPFYQVQQPAQKKSRTGCIAAFSTFVIGSVFLLISVYIQSLLAPNKATPRSAAPPSFQTVVAAQVEATAKPAPTRTRRPASPTPITDTPTRVAVPPTPTAEVTVFEILDPVDYKLQYSDYLFMIGIIRYKGTVVRMSPEIVVTLTDAGGKVLATKRAYITPRYIRPDSTIPYKVLFDDVPEDWAKWEIDVSAERFGGYMADLLYTDLEVDQPTLNAPSNNYTGPRVVGRVKNTGSSTAKLVQIIGALYDAEGRLLDVANTFSKKDTIEAGGDGPFELEFRSDVEGATFELFVEGHKE